MPRSGSPRSNLRGSVIGKKGGGDVQFRLQNTNENDKGQELSLSMRIRPHDTSLHGVYESDNSLFVGLGASFLTSGTVTFLTIVYRVRRLHGQDRRQAT
ncbi:MAG: hypothetical protein ABSE36_19160 [Terracidiphilus sp.]|jgi:hypothetical protein